MGYADPVASSSQHSGATSRKPRDGFRASFHKRRSFFGARSEPIIPPFDPITNSSAVKALPTAAPAAARLHGVSNDFLPEQVFPPSQTYDHERAEATAATVYHHSQHQYPPPPPPSPPPAQHQSQEQQPQQQKRRSIFPSRFKLSGSKENQSHQHQQEPEPRSTYIPPYTEQLLRLSQHTRALSLPDDVNEVQHQHQHQQHQHQQQHPQQPQQSEHARLSSRPHSAVMPPLHTSTSSEHHHRASKKFTISAPFNFQHVTHTNGDHLPALNTVEEGNLTKEFWAASTYTSPGLQQPATQTNDLARTLGVMGIWKGMSGARPTTPRRPDTQRPDDGLSRVRSNSREDITALPGFVPPKKESAIQRRQDVDALLGLGGGGGAAKPRKKPEGLKRSESTKPKNDSSPSLLGFDFGLRPTRSHSTSSRRTEKSLGEDSSAAMLGFGRTASYKRPEKPVLEDSSAAMMGFGRTAAKRSAESSRSNPLSVRDESSLKAKASLEQHRSSESSSRVPLMIPLIGSKERSRSESSSAQKRTEVGTLLGMSARDTQRSSKHTDTSNNQDETSPNLGIRPNQQRSASKPRQSPAPLRPRRSDEGLRAVRYEVTQPALSPHLPSPTLSIPERPKRETNDSQLLRDMGFAQLLYRTNSNGSRHSPNSSISTSHVPIIPRRSEDRPSRVSVDAESIYPPEVPEYPEFGASVDAVAEEVERNTYRNQQIRYRAKQPLPSLPEQIIAGHEARSPLQTVDEDAEYGSPVSPLMSAVVVSTSPVSPTSTHSAHMMAAMRSPELTGPDMPDDETWMDEIDFLYKQHAEATNDFDWDNVSMTPQQRLSTKDPDKRLSLNIPSLNVPGAAGLAKKLSEGSLRQSYHLPSSRTSNDLQYIYHDIHRSRKFATPNERHANDHAVAGARSSPEVRVVDVDDKRHDSRHPQQDVASLHMHGYESLAAGYLSDPESSSSKHRKSNSNGSWESRRSGTVPKEQPGRSSHTSLSSNPDLLPTRRGPKQPITSIPQANQQPQSPYQEPPAQHPMHEYAAFSVGPYAAGSESRPQSQHRVSVDHQQYPMPDMMSQQQQQQQQQQYLQQHQFQSQQLHQQHNNHFYHQPQEYSAAVDYLSLRRPETIDENAILRAAGDAVRHGRADPRVQGRTMHSANSSHYQHHVLPPPPAPSQQPQHHQYYQQQQHERAGWI